MTFMAWFGTELMFGTTNYCPYCETDNLHDDSSADPILDEVRRAGSNNTEYQALFKYLQAGNAKLPPQLQSYSG